MVLHILFVVGVHQCHEALGRALHFHQAAVFEQHAALLAGEVTDVVDDLAGCGLPAVVGDAGGTVGVEFRVEVGRNLLLEVLAVHHVAVRPAERCLQGLVGGFIVGEADIADGVVAHIGLALQLAEDVLVVVGDIGDLGNGEGRTAATDAAP